MLTAWDPRLFRLLSCMTRHHSLSVILSSTTSDQVITVTNVYAPADHRDSSEFLAGLLELPSYVQGAWFLMGDFNLLRGLGDKNNDSVDLGLCRDFNTTIDALGVMEVPLRDALYTWSNKRAVPTLSRLDRVFVNLVQASTFPSSFLTSLPRPTSDHKPIKLTVSTSVPKSQVFRFENAWLKNGSFLPTVTPAWHNAPLVSDAAGQLAACLKGVRAASKVWARRNRAPPAIIPNCKFLIQLFDHYEEHRALSAAELQVRSLCVLRLDQAIQERAAYWKQRSKQRAIREGDANTAFHHAHATVRLRSNQIKSIEVDGCARFSHEDKTAALTSHYRAILGAPIAAVWRFDVLDLYRGRPGPSEDLTAPLTISEAKVAVKDMNKCSAPGPDGFGPSFYQAAWDTIAAVLEHFCLAFQDQTVQLERVNRSFIVLLPKTPGACAIGSFRPISLQNCCVKIIAKLLTTRLQKQIGRLVDVDQTGFIRGRSITENFVYALELVQLCHKRKAPTVVLKLDFAKAFDSISWDGLFTILRARGFNDTWCAWMHCLLSSSTTAILVNGCPGPWIQCKRGLRQGDPLSPYLFLLVADVLQALIQQDSGVLHPLVDHAPCPVLQYADDTLILLRGEVQGVSRLREILDSFAAATGLRINYSKSTLVPIHMDGLVVDQCVALMGCKLEGFPQTYLGLPLSVTKLRPSSFEPYIAKVDRRLAGWQASVLNPMGRAVLVNAVLSSQMVYLMCAVPLPPGVVAQVDRRRRGFLWTGEDSAAGAQCLVAWDRVCDDKAMGGLGVKDLALQNTCLLLKLLYRLHTAEDSSWASWARGNVCLATLEGGMMGGHWEVLRALLPLFQAITSSVVGDGAATDFWHDAWLGGDDLASRFPALFSHCRRPHASVRDVLSRGVRHTLVPRLSRQANAELVLLDEALAAITLSEEPDARLSPFAAAGGKLRTGALYRVLRDAQRPPSPETKFIWGSGSPPRVQFFIWLLTQERVQCRANLARKCVVDSADCELCPGVPETTAHIFLECPFAVSFWTAINMSQVLPPDVRGLLSMPRPSHIPAARFSAFIQLCCWRLWKRRNELVFKGEEQSLPTMLSECKNDARLWVYRFKRDEQVLGDAWCRVFSRQWAPGATPVDV
ncbi:hypothetical protein U9M48_011614 [Paspalum notatum var. saurae]|uniref:Reverse transcriptase domain-containing protein n=1 Tax=Paspalum notatum var. saurae TaxID=547442 RepID=A0AAQ3WHN6_PASNO